VSDTLGASVAVSDTNTVGVAATTSFGAGKIVSAAVQVSYSHTWGTITTQSQTETEPIPPGYTGQLAVADPYLADTGNMTIDYKGVTYNLENTTWNHFDAGGTWGCWIPVVTQGTPQLPTSCADSRARPSR
jgi:hypothetical protein